MTFQAHDPAWKFGDADGPTDKVSTASPAHRWELQIVRLLSTSDGTAPCASKT